MTAPITLYDANDRPVMTQTARVGHPEIFIAESQAIKDYLSAVQNIDKVIGKHGWNIYEEMYDTDGQVRSAMWYAVSIALSPDWAVNAADEGDPDDLFWKRFVDYNLRHMDISVNQFQWDLYRGSWGSGMQLMEIIWRRITEPCEFQGYIGIDTITPVYPDSVEFYPNENDDIEDFGDIKQNYGGETVPLDPQKFIHYPNDPRWKNPWGNSDQRPAYKPYKLKDFGWRWWGIFLERFGGPIPIGRYDDYVGKPQRDEFLKVIRTFKTMGGGIFPKSWDLQFLEAAGSHTDAFERMQLACDHQIARAMLLPELVMSEGQNHSTLGLGVMQYYGPFLSKEKFKISLGESIINKQLVKRLVRANDPERRVYEFPIFARDEIRETPDANLLKLFEMLLAKPNWAATLDPASAQWVSTQTGLPLPPGIAERPPTDVDDAATQANELLAQIETDWKAKGRVTRLSDMRRLLLTVAVSVKPTMKFQQADSLAAGETGKWKAAIETALTAAGHLGDFQTERMIYEYRKELKANA